MYSTVTVSPAVKSADTVHTSALMIGEIELIVRGIVVLSPVSALAPATTSILPSSLSAIPFAFDQAVLS